MQKENRRIRYTKMVLRESLLKLMKEKPVGKISVSALCADADISRGTFYQHYLDPVDLLNSIKQELYNNIYEKIVSIDLKQPTQSMFEQICNVLYQNRDLCDVICGEHGDKSFLVNILEVKREYFIAQWEELLPEINPKQLSYYFTFSAAGCVAIIEEWVKKGYTDSPKLIGEVCSRIMRSLSYAGRLPM